jgi:hypothetical protein
MDTSWSSRSAPASSQAFLTKHSSLRWVGLRVDVSSQKAEPRTYGRVILDTHSRSQRPGLPGFEGPAREIEWNWYLLPEDLERIERDRGDAKSSLFISMSPPKGSFRPSPARTWWQGRGTWKSRCRLGVLL